MRLNLSESKTLSEESRKPCNLSSVQALIPNLPNYGNLYLSLQSGVERGVSYNKNGSSIEE